MFDIQHPDRFVNRHLGPNKEALKDMLATIGVDSLEQLIEETVPSNIRYKKELNLPEAMSEFDYLNMLKEVAAKNKVFKSYIGLGYYPTITPPAILRNVFQNPGWYTPYTPYQAEIAQGRLEALLNFQTMVSDLTGLPIANASLLDEGTAAAEAMYMFYNNKNKRAKGDLANQILVSKKIYPQTLDVIYARAEPLDIEVVLTDTFEITDKTFAILLQYPDLNGEVVDYKAIVEKAQANKIHTIVAADLMSLALLTPPGEWGADAVVGNTQRFGVPMGFGGPHAAYFATKDDFKRQIPGRIIGVSIDSSGDRALRMALQTREQHIRRDKATSNICTAQALLAVMASMYAVYHGPDGIKAIAGRMHTLTQILDLELQRLGYKQLNSYYFDTIKIEIDPTQRGKIKDAALAAKMNFYYADEQSVQISLNEVVDIRAVAEIINVFAELKGAADVSIEQLVNKYKDLTVKIPADLVRTTAYLTHPTFNTYHSESQLMRYIKMLENKDLSLVHSMISLGSCTMKLNAATEMFPVSWPEFSDIHPFAPSSQTKGYEQLINELEDYLCVITGFDACSLMSNSGAQGEYSGLLAIRAYHKSRGEGHRNIALIPSSAHGTNPASAVLAGMKVVVTKCDERGNLDINDLAEKAEKYKDNLAALMVTYPSTHGVFEANIKEVCALIHKFGGKVYMDGANMNAQVGLTSPGEIGADVCHLNLHKTFAIPHGGGGPGMGPICVNESLAPFLPKHAFRMVGGSQGSHAVSAAPWGSASILLISYGYIRLLGRTGCKAATEYAILNANYIKAKLETEYDVLYTGEQGRAAHELIIDLRNFKAVGVSAEDVAKRLMDYGFHAPTMSFPVAGTIMIEPTESEDQAELDRFCDALLEIRKEIDEIATGKADAQNNVLHNAPHKQTVVVSSEWDRPYSVEKAVFPLPYLRTNKFWPQIGRVNNAYGDKNLICACPPMEMYEEVEA
ncbi:aminomethyl-transferring glycine dehydrogenase [Aureispira sp. CCB-E]|uniref:aminomethyl-transferring glycine dehydrogenase n=1 Tax=Aureispira sp. CCB-E TaxID=3051121 RepID=UPI002869125C|nr:aminomethyl-transferring glycine dehydrogenase [Aureispira sp. CCB-E]WMX13902.1 aminomethyl-transferring glycine dehydrogenase [Aureispira sp. CCB-E]